MKPFTESLTPASPTMLDAWEHRVRESADQPFLHSFSETLSFGEVDQQADALAASLAGHGVAAGDRVALYTQNDPLFAVGVIAAWKLGAVGVPINPMNTARELRYHLQDSGAKALVTLPTLWDDVAAEVVADSSVRVTVLGGFLRWQPDGGGIRVEAVPADIGAARPAPDGSVLLSLEDLPRGKRTADRPGTSAADPALLTYTSGTTGSPKGAINTHGNIAFNAETYAQMGGLEPGQPILAVAPLFHITGSVGHLAYGIRAGCPLVLSHRFHPVAVIESIRQWRPVFTIGAITALMAIADSAELQDGDLASLEVVFTGGAPVAPSLSDRLEKVYGSYIHSAYGMSETASPITVGPVGERSPVDPDSGSLSVGRAVYDTELRIVDDAGADLPDGEYGEIWARGPQITPGYWQNDAATAAEITDGGFLHTGDVAFRDAEGWIYLVDRKKDMINAAGYKVWPREVEGVLYDHAAVSEAAVVGVADDYRGETVAAYVTVKTGQSVTEEELVAHCREQLAAYKIPRSIGILDEMPKTATGKIMRRALRD
ncbi:class I adenylate-forming enzyme family protein [Brevibacterium yomogidense]|uniref:Long-chain-fatty-acid--CoA ligase n=1 Tax=Brevibacterium yomogidense TaxID=946573 RepID=A0A1X6WU47_9MICO|nr:AMP-binding protein [Brevibacterium yomogidense]SLM88559.1 Long-chain-fatty-acid--CoA ligase [Brevibacterium yomogidense]